MRERFDRADVPAIREHGRSRGLGTVVLVTASALMLAGAVTGWMLIGGDGQGSAASLGTAGTVHAQQRAGNQPGAGDEGEKKSARLPLPPVPVVLPPLPESEPTPSPSDRAGDSSRGEKGDSSENSDSSDSSDSADGSDQTDREPPPAPEPTPEPEPEPKPQPRPRVAVLTTEAEYGFAAGVRIVNDGDRPLTWKMRLTYDNVQVTGGWQADIQQNDATVTIRGRDQTATIPPGEQAIFGYHLTGEVQEPTGCTLNGKPCRLVTR